MTRLHGDTAGKEALWTLGLLTTVLARGAAAAPAAAAPVLLGHQAALDLDAAGTA